MNDITEEQLQDYTAKLQTIIDLTPFAIAWAVQVLAKMVRAYHSIILPEVADLRGLIPEETQEALYGNVL